jgi:hypothetical protein
MPDEVEIRWIVSVESCNPWYSPQTANRRCLRHSEGSVRLEDHFGRELCGARTT